MIAAPNRDIVAKSAGLAVVCALASLIAVTIAYPESGIAPFWPANAIALVVMIRGAPGTWLYYLAAAYLSEVGLGLAFGEPLYLVLMLAWADTLDIVAAFALVRPFTKDIGGSRRLSDFLRFLGLAAILAPAAGAALAASLEASLFGGSYGESLFRWWASGAVGIVLVAPFCLELTRSRLRQWREGVVPLEVGAMVALTATFVVVVFTQPHFFMLFLILPFLLWSALRAGRLGVAGVGLLIIVLALWFTVQGDGPVAAAYPNMMNDQVIFLQVFIVSLTLPALVIATVYGERLRTETDLNKAVRRLQATQTMAKLLYWERAISERETSVPGGQEAVIVDDLDALRGLSSEDYIRRFVHPDDRERVGAAFAQTDVADHHYDTEYRFLRPDGDVRMVREIGQTDLTAGTLIGTLQDVTELHETERALMQAQKMEAVGQLTGGIAHDFNNLLTIVIGNLELAESRAGSDETLKAPLSKAMAAADRGAALTGRLLAFSRKQPLRPQPVNAARLARSMMDLLHRSLGETIEISQLGDAGLWACHADPSQLENAFMNLAINARDAMPRGGKLTIETSNVELARQSAAADGEVVPGQYVCVAFRDTGAGMTAETIEKAFDPFFTTKETGKGTGLGLSMVYGFAKQSNAHIRIDSEVGRGTTVRLYLPRAHCQPAVANTPDSDPTPEARSGETILVVEDDTGLRQLTLDMLADLGYAAQAAGTGRHALDILNSDTAFDLLLLDVVLPGGMSGADIADKARRLRPDLPVLFMSGYSDNAIIHEGRLDEGVLLLEKPFRKKELARALRDALPAEDPS